MVVLATRPDGIKMMPVIHALRGHPAGFRVTLCATGQHRDMLRAVLAEFGLAADVDLDVMRPDQEPVDLLASLLPACHRAMVERAPDLVLIQGDTTSALAAALAANLARVDLAHLEAGLRTASKRAPFPEEMNRRLIGRLADLHFAPTEAAAANLRAEGVPPASVHVTGNTVVDALMREIEVMRRGDRVGIDPVLGALVERHSGRLVLVTCHRRESFGAPLLGICEAIRRLAGDFPALAFVLPMHPNPNVRRTVLDHLSGIPQLNLVEPVTYRSLLFLLQHARLVLTDSGGIQEEAPSFGVPVLVMREETDRPEAIAAGFGQLVGRDPARIVTAARALLRGDARRLEGRPNPYGDGNAAARVADILAKLP